MNRFCGIDFSGARLPGKHIWICVLETSDKGFCLKAISSLSQIFPHHVQREECYAKLVEWLLKTHPQAVGFDFPFGLPASLVKEDHLVDFIHHFPANFPTEHDFYHYCLESTHHQQQKRLTDQQARAPFSPYNLRVYRQTYWGIRAMLHPLLGSGKVKLLPHQKITAGHIHLMEVCPASFLKKHGLYKPYKGTTSQHRQVREAILQFCQEKFALQWLKDDHRDVLVQNENGDALDSLICSLIAAQHWPDPIPKDWHPLYEKEGFIYF